MGEKLKRVVLLLRKLGILRFGTTSYTYTSGKDMPAHAVLDDVYDEEKDLVRKEDFIKKAPLVKPETDDSPLNYCTQCGVKLSKDNLFCSACGSPVS